MKYVLKKFILVNTLKPCIQVRCKITFFWKHQYKSMTLISKNLHMFLQISTNEIYESKIQTFKHITNHQETHICSAMYSG